MKCCHAVVLSTCLALGAPLGALADEVFEASLSLSAAAQDGPSIEKLKVTSDALVNVALGRDPEAPVADAEVLALVVDCESPELRLSVVDPAGPTELAKIASGGELDLVSDAKGGVVVAQLEVATVGGEDNRFDGGYLVLAGTFKPGPMGCPSSVKTSVSGVLDVTLTVEGVTESFAVLVTKGKLGTRGDSIGSLP